MNDAKPPSGDLPDEGVSGEGAQDQGATWSDESDPVVGADPATRPRPVVGSGPLVGTEKLRHVGRMQLVVLFGLGGFFLLTMIVIVVGPWVGAIEESLAEKIMQTVLPPLLASGATIVGTLFTSDRSS